MRKTENQELAKLYYLNHYDEHNGFKGKVCFPNIQCVKLANVLCQDDDMVDRYIRDYYNPEFEQWEIINSLQQLKRDLKAERTDLSEYKEKIKECIEIGDYKYLWTLLQNLFLEYLTWEQLEEILELIHSGVDEENIMDWYNKDKKILAMTTFSVEYIKSVTSK